MVYSCIVRVLHESPLGEAYMRTHIVVVRIGLHDAVLECGARAIGMPCLDMHYPLPEILYSDPPVCIDPANVILELPGLEGSVYVPLPYQCTFEHMAARVIPAKLRSLGLPWKGELRATARDLYSANHVFPWHPRGPERCGWPLSVLRGVKHLQRQARASGYVLV